MAAWNAGNRLDMAYGESECVVLSVVEAALRKSEGKEGKGLFPVGLACTTDLHSLGQYIQRVCVTRLKLFFLSVTPTLNQIME